MIPSRFMPPRITTPLILSVLSLVAPTHLHATDDDDDKMDIRSFVAGDGIKQATEEEAEDMVRAMNNGVIPGDFDFPHAPDTAEESPEQKIVTFDDWTALNAKAGQNDPEALYIVGLCYAKGHIKRQDLHKASRFFLTAAMKGTNPDAQFLCARSLELKYGVRPGEEQAAHKIIGQFYGFSSMKGHVRANYHYAYYFKYVAPKKVDAESIASHFRVAAEKGHAAAQYELALCYREGEGVSKFRLLSHKLMRVSAEQGFAKAQYDLGLCYASGNYRVQKNPVEAYAWIATAISNGVSDDTWAMANLKNQLSPAELEAAKTLAADYSSKFKSKPPSTHPLF